MNNLSNFLKKEVLVISIMLCIAFLFGCNSVLCDHTESNWIVDTKPSIYKEGSQHKECTKCGEVLITESIPKLCNHIESNWIVDTKPSIYKEGFQHKECTKCGEVLITESIPKLCNHIESNWIVDTEPSIYKEGSQHKECTKCGEVLITESIPKLCNHIESNWIVDVKATLENEGTKHTECIKCGEIIQTQIIPELEYSLSEVKQLLSKSMVKVYCYDYDGETLLSQGSGFFINRTGTFITNAHVVKDAYYIKIKNYLGFIYDVNVMYVYNYSGSDHAICRAQNCFSTTPVEFEEDVSVGDTVYAFGYPNDAFMLSSTQGTVTATNVVDKGKTYIENTARIDHGSSGGILANSKGKVVGITTGILGNSKYAALSYSEIKSDVTKSHFGTKEPLEWFHTKKEISLASYNVERYFDVYVNGKAITDTSVSYDVTLKLKSKYASEKFILDNISLTVSINLKTKYEWKEIVSYGTANRSQSTTDYVSVTFFNERELIRGKSTTAHSSIYISSFKEYYGMNITYEVDFSSVFGKLVFYDPSALIY